MFWRSNSNIVSLTRVINLEAVKLGNAQSGNIEI